MDALQKEVQRVLEKAPGIGVPKTIASSKHNVLGKSRVGRAPTLPHPSRGSSGSEDVLEAIDALLSTLERKKQSTLPANYLATDLLPEIAKCSKVINDRHKEYYNALSKLGKALDKKFTISLEDVADAKLFKGKEAQEALASVIRDHLERTGEWDVARTFEREAGIGYPSSLPIGTFQQLQSITTALESGNSGPAIRWAAQERDFLEARHSPLEFSLHRSRFLRIALGQDTWSVHGKASSDYHEARDGMESDDEQFVEAHEHHISMPDDPDGETVEMADADGASAATHHGHAVLDADGDDVRMAAILPMEVALHYGRRFLRPQTAAQLEEVKRLFTYLLFLPETPQAFSKAQLSARIPIIYQGFLNDDEMHASALVPLFQREFTAKQGIARQAPLHVAVEVGAGGALNLIIRVRTLMRAKGNEWSQADELPVEIPLPPHLRFHSTFACPVSKEQGTDENPPMMMACGHVVCNESLMRLSKSTGRVKCPYCPIESTAAQAMRVYF